MNSKTPATSSSSVNLSAAVDRLFRKWRLVSLTAVAGAICAVGVSFLIPPTFTARTVIVSPQQQQNSAAAALASLGALSGIASAAAGIKSPADQYVALMQSVNVTDRIIDKFELMKVYKAEFRVDARKELGENTRLVAGKKDNLITIEVDDHDRKQAAAMANMYVEELRRLTNTLALTEAQQRRSLFEQQLSRTKEALRAAQVSLQRTGISDDTLKTEPKALAETYARLKAEVSATEIRLAAMRRTMTDSTPEVQRLHITLAGLRNELSTFELSRTGGTNEAYINAYREYKYQETLFEIFSRQFELARLDEAREGTLIQVLDTATEPERKSKPRRSIAALIGLLLGTIVASYWVLGRARLAS